MKKMSILKNEDGSVLIVALMMLVLLTIIGVSASKMSEIDIMIAGNERVYKQNFYRAEASAMDSVQVLDNEDLENPSLSWLFTSYSSYNENIWDTEQANLGNSLDSNTEFFSLSLGVVEGGSLDMSKSKVYEYEVYGRSTQNRGQAIVSIGYRKAY